MSKLRQGGRILVVALGVVLVGFLLREIGIRNVADRIALVGWGMLPLLCR
jgi:hypothetical protein